MHEHERHAVRGRDTRYAVVFADAPDVIHEIGTGSEGSLSDDRLCRIDAEGHLWQGPPNGLDHRHRRQIGVAPAIGSGSRNVVLKQIDKTISEERNSGQWSIIATVKTVARQTFVLFCECT